ncbi:acireductone synthase [Frankia sp. AgB1.9]|uniref:acireductone synthase n=1 Tax=unclassified Frankia TaxID=2632575 RepID=UPI001933E6D2|nr:MULTISPECIES: acireductone synthase [unclassified Frankia]MBL7491130.1 acireductone synthase [Frankia sp. AgW1.1]MBL7550247.1 acireductone synthase [Frankia sp. AgB1.9]MBL7624451.1 acireductone synthase [Frankia sp. AgB1.8]
MTASAGLERADGVTAVVVDIEGTTSPTAAVVGTLYPYARARLAGWLAGHADDPQTCRAVAQVRELLGEPAADLARVIATLDDWLARDVKAAPLKTLQGQIWAAGFAAGELTGVLFGDVAPALRRWHAAGIRLAVYSSGSAVAQQAWFGRAAALDPAALDPAALDPASLDSAGWTGRERPDDLGPLLSAHFDLDTAGPKTAERSYARIAAALNAQPDRLLFLTDRPAELDAARAAGWRVVGVARPGEPYAAALAGYPCVVSFADLSLTAA